MPEQSGEACKIKDNKSYQKEHYAIHYFKNKLTEGVKTSFIWLCLALMLLLNKRKLRSGLT
jgi:hypothetical protein